MAEYAINEIQSNNLSQMVIKIGRMIHKGESWQLTVITNLDGTGDLFAKNLETKSEIKLPLGQCIVKQQKNTERRK